MITVRPSIDIITLMLLRLLRGANHIPVTGVQMFNLSFITRSSDCWMLYANNLSNVQQLNTNLKQLIASPVFRKTNREEKCPSGDGCGPVGSSQQLYPPSTGADCKVKWMRAVDLRKGWRVNSMFRGSASSGGCCTEGEGKSAFGTSPMAMNHV